MARRRTSLNLTPLEDRSTPAALYTVNSAGDTLNAHDGVLTLREALLAERGDLALAAAETAQVQTSAPGLTRDTIQFAASLGGQTIAFTTNDAANRYGPTGFVVTTAVAIDGRAGTGRGVTLSGGGVQRLFAVTSTGDLALSNLELVNGLAQGGSGYLGGGGAAGLGGAIFVDQGSLNVTASTLTNNQAAGGAGGGRAAVGQNGGGGGLQASAAHGDGGGPNGGAAGVGLRRPGYAGGYGGGGGAGGNGTVNIPYGSSTPAPGSAGGDGGFGGGGGSSGDTVSFFSPSSGYSPTERTGQGGAGGFGGGGGAMDGSAGFGGGAPAAAYDIHLLLGAGGGGAGLGGAIFNNAGAVVVTNSTLTANTAVGGAGGLATAVSVFGRTLTAQGGAGRAYGGAVFSRNGTLAITASTLSANTAASSGTAVAVLADGNLGGGGDTANTGAAAVTLTDSVLGQATAAGTDLVTLTNGTGAAVTATGTANLIRTTAVTTVGRLAGDPLLGPLQDNGGPTRTMAPSPNSPAVDAVVGGTGTDQRGLPRADGAIDLGAVELQSAPGGSAALTPTALPDGTATVAYRAAVTATGVVGAWTFAVTGGALPPGLTLPATGRSAHTTYLGGTPTTAGTYTFTITATNGTGTTASRAYTLVVAAAAAPSVNPATLPVVGGLVGTFYSVALSVTGSPGATTYAVTAGSLPSFLTLNPSTGVLSGAVMRGPLPGAYPFTVTATTAAYGPVSGRYTLIFNTTYVTVGPAVLPDGQAGTAYAQTLTAVGADLGSISPVGPYTFAVTGGDLPPGLALATGGDLTGTPTTLGTYPFTVVATSVNGWTGVRDYTVVVGLPPVTITPATLPDGQAGAAYAQTVTATGGLAGGPYTFAVTAGFLPPGLTLTTAGDLNGTPATPGTYPFTVTATAADGQTGTREYQIVVPPVTVGPAALPDGQAGAAYAQTLTAAGPVGPYAFAVTGGTLPPGLTLTAAGDLAGTPTTAGTFPFTVTATAIGGFTGERLYSLTVVPPVAVGPASLPGARVSVHYDQQLAATGPAGTYTFAVAGGTLPSGLTLSTAGRLFGTPTAEGSFAFTVAATTAGGLSGSRTYTVPVGPAPAVTVSPAALPDPQVGTPYDQTLTAIGEAAPYTFTVAGTLPPGLTLSPAGRLTGTPTTAGPYTFSVTATSVDGFAGGRDYDVIVATPGTVVIGPRTLPTTQVGTAYAVPLTAVGDVGSYTFLVTGGSLPPGVTLSAAGVLAGTPTTAGTFAFTVTATSARGVTGRQDLTIEVVPPVVIAPAVLSGGRQTVAYAQTLTASGPTGPYTFRVTTGTLPAGLTLSGAGRITGTPTATGSFIFTTTATSSAGWTATATYTVTVGPAPVVTVGPAALPDPQVGTPYDQTLTAVGEAAPYAFAVAGTLPPGLTLSPAGRLTGTPTTAGPYTFSVTATSADGFAGSRDYTGVVQPPVAVGPLLLPDGVVTVPYDQTLTASGPAGPYTFLVTASVLPPGLMLSPAGRLSGTPTAVGSYAFTVTAASAGGYAGRRDYVVAIVAPGVVTIRPTTLPDAQVGTAYGQPLTASGEVGPYTFAVTAGTLPPGLTLSPTTGELAGTPTAAGPYSFTVTATSVRGFAGDRALELVVVLPVAVVANLPGGRQGGPYTGTLTATGPAGPYTFALSGGLLPPGLTLSAAGAITGVPTAAGDYPFTVTATTAAGWVGTLGVRLPVGAVPALTVGPAALPDPQVGAAYDQTLTASGQAAPYTFAASGTLPPGLTLSADGRLTGTPTEAGRYAFTVTATSADGFTGDVTVTLTVNPATLTVNPATLPDAQVGTAYGQPLTASGEVGPYTFAVTSGGLPPGLTLSPSGQLAGTPTAAGSFAFTVTATTPANANGRQDYVIVVEPGVPPVPPAGTNTAVGGSDGTLTVLGPDGRPLTTLAPFPGYAGGIRTAALAGGRVAAGTGPGRATAVKVLDPATGRRCSNWPRSRRRSPAACSCRPATSSAPARRSWPSRPTKGAGRGCGSSTRPRAR